MFILRRLSLGLALIAFSLLLSGCAIKDLKDDLETAKEDYGYLKGRASGVDDDAVILVALLREEVDGATIASARSVDQGEQFYVLVPDATYTLVAFSDSNGDLSYQAGEPAARIDDPAIN